MKIVLSFSTLAASMFLLLSPSALSQKTKTSDPLVTFLASKGFANIPYIKQNQAKIGAVVAAPHAGGIPTFEVPAKATPTANPNPGIEMPGEVVSQIQSAGLGLKIFGFDSGADFEHPETLNYKTVTLTGPQLDIDQVRTVLNDPETIKKLDNYKGDLTAIKKNQKFYAELYLVSGVFYSTGMDITLTSGTEVSLKANATIPACPSVPADPTKPTPDPTKPDATKPSTTTPNTTKPDTTKPTSANTTTTTPQTSPVNSVETTVTNDANKVVQSASDAAKTVTNAASSATSAATPGGYVQYCRKVTGEVHFTSDHPIPVGMEVYYVSWNGSKYEALSPTKTPQFSNR